MVVASHDAILGEELSTSLEFRSPSVDILAQRFLEPGKCQVLDLGAPAKSNVAFFFGGPCKFYLEDLNRFFIAPRERRESKGDEDDNVASAIAEALSYEHTARFDLVLAWDLFSYLDRATIEMLMARVARSCHTGTLLFLTVSTAATIPSAPARISMTHGGRLHYRSAVDGPGIPNPRFSTTALQSMLPDFRLLHSFLLKDEMQEFLFSYA